MSLLAIDIGTGTQDILIHTSGEGIERSPQLVLPSPTVVKAREVARATREGIPVFLEGSIMGGGPLVRAVRAHTRAGYAACATEEAARTLHDNPERVRQMGVEIVESPPAGAVHIHTSDYMEGELQEIWDHFHLAYPDRFAFAVQDHGFSPEMSNRLFRFRLLQELLEAEAWSVSALAPDPPRPEMTRMWGLLDRIPDALVMDTGPAAILGTLCDPRVAEQSEKGVILVNAGNSHTLCVTLRGEEIYGLCEQHTMALTPSSLQALLKKLQEGTLTNEEIFASGGHGAAVHRPLGAGMIAVTGPHRRRLLPDAYQAAPYGDMMLTGCFGLLHAWNRAREGGSL